MSVVSSQQTSGSPPPARPHLWPRAKSLLLLVVTLGLIAGSTLLTRHIWRENGLRALQAINEQRVQLVAIAVKAEINRQDHLPVVLSLDADVRNALAAPADPARLTALSEKLERVSREADTRALYVMGPDGTVLASDDFGSDTTLIGRNFASRAYFARALKNGKGSSIDVEPGSNRVRYYIAEAVRDAARPGGAPLGVAAVRIEFDSLEAAWERAGERVLITDADGIVFLASDATYKFHRLTFPGTPASRPRSEAAVGLYPNGAAAPATISVIERRGSDALVRVTGAGDDVIYSYQSTSLPEYGWTIHRFAGLSSIDEDQRDGAIIGFTISALIVSLLLYVAQRHRAFLAAKESGARLKSEVAERTHELSDANASLHREIDERRSTEARLRTTQNQLVQAGKLAALGQMSAAIAHEINQPLAAIRTFLASTRIFAARGDIAQVGNNLDLINSLAERMASITSHLKTFARKSEPGRPELVKVERALDGALFLIDGQIRSAQVRIEKDIQPDVWVTGYAVQLEQVLVNLIGNALDAVAHLAQPLIRLRVSADDTMVSISIADNGPGIAPDTLDQIFDPFFTTKPIGKGLGLGLSISYGIVQDFDGHINAVNRPEGGAELTVELPRRMHDGARPAAAIHA